MVAFKFVKSIDEEEDFAGLSCLYSKSFKSRQQLRPALRVKIFSE
jgi:hypothetical protein